MERLFPTPDGDVPGSPLAGRGASTPEKAGPSAVSQGLATPRPLRVEDEDHAALLHMTLTQSPACVSLQRGDGPGSPASPLLTIPKLQRQGTDSQHALGTPRLLGVSSPPPSQPGLLESPAVKAATQAAIARAEADVLRQQAAPARPRQAPQRAQRAAAAGVTAATRAVAAAAGMLAAPRRVQSQGAHCSPSSSARGSGGDPAVADDLFPFGTLCV